MKKAVSIFFLTVAIFFISIYIFFYASFNLSSPNSFANHYLRKNLLGHRFLRKLFWLNQVGDARFDYGTDKRFTKLKIIIYNQSGESLWPTAIESIVREIEKVVEKPEGVVVEEIELAKPVSNVVKDRELKQLIKDHPVWWPYFGGTATLQIFVLKKYASVPTYAGLVQNQANIILFMDAIRGVSDRQLSTHEVEISTVLHEFGHLLGAEHVDDEECIMSARAENLTFRFPTIFRTTYCQKDLEEIKKALSF